MSMSRTFGLLTLYFLISGLQTSANAAACYQPDGEEAESSFAPCNSNSSAVSMCCNIQNLDRCTAEGVCVSGSNAYYRDSCTDKTWTSPECIHMCTDTSNPRVTLCDDGSFCCGTDNATCCDGGFGTKLAKTTTAASAIPLTQLYGDITYNPTTGTATFAEYVDTTTSVSTTASTSTSQSVSSSSASLGVSSTTSSTTAVSKASSGNGSQGNGVAIGAGVGVSVGVVLVAIAAALFFWHRKRQNKSEEVKSPEETGEGGSTHKRIEDWNPSTEGASYAPLEYGSMIDSTVTPSGINQSTTPVQVHEMDQSARENVHELPGEHNKTDYYSSTEKFSV